MIYYTLIWPCIHITDMFNEHISDVSKKKVGYRKLFSVKVYSSGYKAYTVSFVFSLACETN